MLSLRPGSYVVAVSGGVDSVVLLDMLVSKFGHAPTRGYTFHVAHYDHGIRPDSVADRQFVGALASKYNVGFSYDTGDLGADASEALARTSRYKFLRQVQASVRADRIMTAHHQDDLLETAIINLIRGTGRRGLTSLITNSAVVRPLLGYRKQDLLTYAMEHKLTWHEDSTNASDRYQRNYVRHRLLSRFTADDRRDLARRIERLADLNQEIDAHLSAFLKIQPAPDQLDRAWFCQLSHSEAKEYLAAWLRLSGLQSYEAKTLERATIAAKVGRPDSTVPLKKDYLLYIGGEILAFKRTER